MTTATQTPAPSSPLDGGAGHISGSGPCLDGEGSAVGQGLGEGPRRSTAAELVLDMRAAPVLRGVYLENFLKKIHVDESGCWIWMAAISTHGYGVAWTGKRTRMAHRVSYELAHGPIGSSDPLDHLCRVRACVNPAHLELVSHRENILRGEGATAKHAAKTHCPRGHAYSDRLDSQGRRRCGVCRPLPQHDKGHPSTWTSCKRGHPFDDENTFYKPNGRRGCRTCRAAQKRQRRAQQKQPS